MVSHGRRARAFAKAQFNVGHMYYTGEGVPKNDTETVQWYRMAAEQGDLPRRSSIWVTCIATAKAFPRITYRPMPGITLSRRKA